MGEAEFRERHRAGRPFVHRATMVGDLLTPVSAYLRLREAFAGPAILLESVEGGAARGRYSMIGLLPDLVWRCEDGRVGIRRDGSAPGEAEARADEPLASLRALVAESAIDLDPGLPPMAAGLFGYLGYDTVRFMERRLGPRPPDGLGIPEGLFVRPTLTVVFDSVRDEISFAVPVRPRPEESVARAYEHASGLVDRAMAALAAPLAGDAAVATREVAAPNAAGSATMEPGRFEAMTARAKEYIAAGDIFQVVLSQRFEAPFTLPPFALYRSLRRVNPAPFLCFLDFEDFQIVCSSPEILVRLRGGQVTVRPIAGTRPRGSSSAVDAALAAELLADPKERAEHLMLLDLGRNDVGRVARLGSVAVTDSFFIERYSHVMHIVSNVEGALRPDLDALDALAAGFPAGTVSGAPKIRAMEIIDELEPHGRGPYGGCIGYLGADGQMDTCIVLRTALVKDGRMIVQAGAGIVADSDPAAEQQECVNKAEALFRAAADALRFAADPPSDRYAVPGDEGWRRSAAAWIRSVADGGDWSRRHVLDRAMIERVRQLAPETMLDVGCGEGRFCRLVRDLSVHPVGIDPVDTFVDEAKRLDPEGDYRVASAEALPFADASFDLAVSYLTLIDIDDFRAAIREMARVVRPGGSVLVANLTSFSTAGSPGGWVRDPDGSMRFPIDHYLDARAQEVTWSGVKVTNWHRPLRDYMTAFIGAGLVLTHFDEPEPHGGAPNQAERYRRVPWLLVAEWQRP